MQPQAISSDVQISASSSGGDTNIAEQVQAGRNACRQMRGHHAMREWLTESIALFQPLSTAKHNVIGSRAKQADILYPVCTSDVTNF